MRSSLLSFPKRLLKRRIATVAVQDDTVDPVQFRVSFLELCTRLFRKFPLCLTHQLHLKCDQDDDNGCDNGRLVNTSCL